MSRSILLAGLLALRVFPLSAQTTAVATSHRLGPELVVSHSRYEVQAGHPVPLSVQSETLDFLVHATDRKITLDGAVPSGLTAGPNSARDQILLAPSLAAKPGEYSVTLSATSASGEERRTTLDVVVRALATVPSGSTRQPVVLINGWITGFTNACTVAADSTATFGNLAQYLLDDGVPVVYFFDNCAEGSGSTIEALGADLGTALNAIKYDSGAQVPQIDIVAHSMGGLIARAYLAGMQSDQSFQPPTSTLVRDLVLIATPNFGSFVAGNYASEIVSGSQSAELVPGSAFLWNLATWNQRGDDLRGINTISIVGNAGIYSPSLLSSVALSNASDGIVSLASGALGFAAVAANTRIVPYCHVDPSAFTNTALGTFECSAAGIANVTSTSHYTGQIVRSFLSGATAWSSIGSSPTADAYLSKDGGMFFALVNTSAAYVSDLTAVSWGTVSLQGGADTDTIYYTDFAAGTGTYVAASSSLGSVNCGSLAQAAGFSSAVRCKMGAAVFSVTPLASASGRVLTAGASVTLNGANLGGLCNGCKVQAIPAGVSTAQTLTVNSWQSGGISVKLPAALTGMATLRVAASTGTDLIGVMIAAGATITASPASLTFTAVSGAAAPAGQSISITNTGAGTLAWTATASDTWITLSATSGAAPSTPVVSVNPTGLAIGAYTGSVQISASNASNGPVSISVTLNVTAAPAVLALSPSTLAFSASGTQTVAVTNAGTGTISWTATVDSTWLSVSPATGAAPATLSVAVDAGNLAAGTYNGVVTVTPADSTVASATISVTLTVQSAQAAGSITAVVNAGSYLPGIASGTWISIFGSNLSALTYSWQNSDFVSGALPTLLRGVSVTIDNVPAYVAYISPTQINALVPDDANLGQVTVQVTTAGQASNSVTVSKTAVAPSLLTFTGGYAAALHADYSLVSTSSPAKPGETILVYGTGFGPSNPPLPTGQLISTAEPLVDSIVFTIGGQQATLVYAGLVESGLCQFNLTIPALANGDAAIAGSASGAATQSGVLLSIHQ